MSNFIVYSCHCYNIRIHLSTKYTNENLEASKKDAVVQSPLSGWEFELGMGGIVTEFASVVKSRVVQPGWKTYECLNCKCGDVYSVADQTSSTQVVIHENAIHGEEIDKLKQNPQYSHIFNIKINDDNKEDLIPMPSVEDVPSKLVSTHTQIQNLMDQSAEKLRLESKTRIEEFKQQEEKRLQESLSKAKLENTLLWSKIIRVTNEQSDDKKEKSHVRFAPVKEDDHVSKPTIKKANFDLDESVISSSLKDKKLDHISNLKFAEDEQQPEDDDDEEEEDMFNLDEEFSDEEKEANATEEIEDFDEDTNDVENKDSASKMSSSFKKSVSEIDQKFSWIKKKRNTSKYLTQDFDIQSDSKKGPKIEEDPSAVSLFATSVPITIHYPAVEELDEEKRSDNESKSKKKDLLATSFANIDFSYSDRMLSEQFPAPRRRKSLASTSLVNPQLDSLVGKSLDTRGLMKKKKNDLERKNDREEFDSSLPPHVWAAMESIDE